ncbi:glycosyltransferase family 61 protein [Spirosoma areae]
MLRKLTGLLLKACRLTLLTKDQTEAYLNGYQIADHPEVRSLLPIVPNEANPTTLIFRQTVAVTHRSYVWNYEPGARRARQLPYGGILTDNNVFCTDYDSHHVAKNFLNTKKRIRSERDIVIAPWSHYLDGVAFGGYYDFVILVAAKLCRIKESMPEAEFAKVVVAYPLFNTAYEQDYLSLIGVEPDRVFDSRLHDIRFSRAILGNSGHWFYPNPTDITALKKQVETKLQPQRTQRNRIYISRSGRRRVVNEEALITLLKKYDFLIIDDKPRSVTEQVTIYKNASFIIGPHGASFTNIIWCEPGTHLFELFSSTYVVEHFLYLSQLMQMSYSAYHHHIKMDDNNRELEENIFVSIADLEKSLDALFEHA